MDLTDNEKQLIAHALYSHGFRWLALGFKGSEGPQTLGIFAAGTVKLGIKKLELCLKIKPDYEHADTVKEEIKRVNEILEKEVPE